MGKHLKKGIKVINQIANNMPKAVTAKNEKKLKQYLRKQTKNDIKSNHKTNQVVKSGTQTN